MAYSLMTATLDCVIFREYATEDACWFYLRGTRLVQQQNAAELRCGTEIKVSQLADLERSKTFEDLLF